MIVWEALSTLLLFLYLLGGALGWGLLGLHLVARFSHTEDEHQKPATLEKWHLSLVLGMDIMPWATMLIGWAGLLYSSVAWALPAVGWSLAALILIQSLDLVSNCPNGETVHCIT